MATAHIKFNDQTSAGRLLRRFLNGAESTLDDGNDLLAMMQQMLAGVGDGTNIAHFDYLVQEFGFGGWTSAVAVNDAMRTVAKACWDEVNSFMAKINTDANVSSVNAALKQIIAKHR
jgi:hypothetical protein